MQGKFGLHSAHGMWHNKHCELVRQHENIYSADLMCTEVWGGAFHPIYQAQMAALYPRKLLIMKGSIAPTNQFRDAVAQMFERYLHKGESEWKIRDWKQFFSDAYSSDRVLTEQEEALFYELTGGSLTMKPQQLQGWLTELVLEGKPHVTW